jgi:SAM-dependent methyltransferase
MTSSWDKYADVAAGWSKDAYADASTYLSRRAELVRTLGPPLKPDDIVLDLACGDGGLADFLPEQRYIGVDASPEMVEAAKRRGLEVVLSDLNEFEPSAPVQATTIFRAIYYARDRGALLKRIAGYTERKLVFDLNPRQYRLDDIRADLRTVGLDRLVVHPFFVPQSVAPKAPIAGLLAVAERIEPIARLVLRTRFTYMCSAFRSDAA